MDKLYLHWLKSLWLSPYTIKNYQQYIVRFMEIADLKTEDFKDEYKIKRAFLHVSDKKPTTLIKFKAGIERYSDYLVEQYWFQKIRVQKVKVPKSLPYSLDRNQVLEIYRVLSKRSLKTQIMIETMLYTWMRRKEVAELKPEDVFDDGIMIRWGKWWKDRFVYCRKNIIHNLRKISWEKTVFSVGVSWVSCACKRIAYLLPFRFFPHLCRHSFATHALRSWIDIYTVSRMLGHNSIETTSIYLHMNSDQTKTEMEKFKII